MTLSVPGRRSAISRPLTSASGMVAPQTVPRPQYEASGVGEAIGEFGDVASAVGTALERERLDRHMRSLELELTQGFGALRSEASEFKSADDMEAHWVEGVAALRQGFLEGQDPRGRPRVDPKIAADFTLAFDALSARHARQIGVRALAARQTERQTTVRALGEEMLVFYAAGDDDDRGFALTQVTTAIDDAVARGAFSPEVGEAEKARWYERAESGRLAHEAEIDDDDLEPEDPEDLVEDRLRSDPQAARLARAMGYVADSDASIEAMSAVLADLDQVPPEERGAWLDARVASAHAETRARLPRPAFAAPGGVDAGNLKEAALRTVEAYRAGKIGRGEYRRQAMLIQKIAGTFND